MIKIKKEEREGKGIEKRIRRRSEGNMEHRRGRRKGEKSRFNRRSA